MLIYRYIYICMCVCFTYFYLHLYVYLHLYLYSYMFISIFIHLFISLFIYLFIYVFHLFIFLCIYIHIVSISKDEIQRTKDRLRLPTCWSPSLRCRDIGSFRRSWAPSRWTTRLGSIGKIWNIFTRNQGFSQEMWCPLIEKTEKGWAPIGDLWAFESWQNGHRTSSLTGKSRCSRRSKEDSKAARPVA